MIIDDIPRLYTAIAEWSACMFYIGLLPRKQSKPKLYLISVLMLLFQGVLLVPTGHVSQYLWIPIMMLAVVSIFITLWLCCDIPLLNIGFWCVRAFLLAEFMASLQWQLRSFIVQSKQISPNNLHNIDALSSFSLLFMGIIYGIILCILHYIEGPSHHINKILISSRELMIAFIIGAGAFTLSNLSFIQSNTPFSSQNSFDIMYIRTLVDLIGVVMLYTFHIQRIELMTRYELNATNTLLQNQYDQYRISRESIALINRKYHDLKHQIGALRSEEDSGRRNQWLDEMEDDIRQYEAQNKTGNSVLDTLLTGKSLYCQKHSITLTCVADGTCLNFMSTMDICAIFGNALDNAIESVMELSEKEKRLIHVKVGRQQSFVKIQVENYFGGSLEFDDGLPVTTKADKAFHGFGIKSIRSTVQKYGGTMTVRTKNGWFYLNLLIPVNT